MFLPGALLVLQLSPRFSPFESYQHTGDLNDVFRFPECNKLIRRLFMKIKALQLPGILLGMILFGSSPLLGQPDLTLYTYDSFNSEWGPGPVVFKRFEEKCRCILKVVAPGDSGSMLNRAILEKNNPRADLVLGINNSELDKSFRYGIWESYRSSMMDRVPQELQMDPKNRVTPFDYGYIAFVYDSERVKSPPQSLEDLTASRFRKKIVIENPKISSPGLSMLHWTISVYGEDKYLDYWNRLKPSLLTITDGWSAAYGMFTKGEVPLVLSYVTSPAYHLEYEKTERYRAAVFQEGHYQQVEFAGILKDSQNQERAREFIDFMLSKDFQDAIPLTNWMFPVINYQPLPESFRIAPKPGRATELDPSLVREKNSQWLKDWTWSMSR